MALPSTRFTIAALGALALGLVLLAPSPAARAEVGANWMVNGAKVSPPLKPAVQEKGVFEGGPLRVLFHVFSENAEYVCNELELIEFALLGEGSSTGKVVYKGCQLIIEEELIQACEPEVKGKHGVIETTKLTALLVLGELEGGSVEPLIRVEPSEGKTFAVIHVNNECNFGGGTFDGVVYLKDHDGKLATEAQSHLVGEGPLTEFFFVTATQPASLDGEVLLGLTNEHAGLKWSGVPA